MNFDCLVLACPSFCISILLGFRRNIVSLLMLNCSIVVLMNSAVIIMATIILVIIISRLYVEVHSFHWHGSCPSG